MIRLTGIFTSSDDDSIAFFAEHELLLECDPLRVYEEAAHLISTLSDRGRLSVADAWAAAVATRSL